MTLLLAFIIGISINLARGEKPDCHCFGQLHSEPIGWQTIARNAVLAGIAGFILLQGRENSGTSLLDFTYGMTGSEAALLATGIVLLGFLAFEGWMLLHLFRQNGRLILRMDVMEKALAGGGHVPAMQAPVQPHVGLSIGIPAPQFELPDLKGKIRSLDSLRSSNKPLMLIFTDPGCGPCNALLPDVANWQQKYKSKINIALISRGTEEENRAKSDEYKIANILLQTDREVAESYQSYGTPMAVIIKPDGTIASSLVGGSDAITTLLETTVGAPLSIPATNGNNGHNGNHVHHGGNGHHHAMPQMPRGLKIREPAPQFELPDLDGKTVRLADFKGKSTLLLFWNPGCGFCTQMLDDIKAWEANPPKGAPELLVVSTGTIDANRAHGFKSTVVIDPSFSVAPLYGGNGTPSAVLVSPDGKIASEVAVGKPGVLALAGADQGKMAPAAV
jgi:methylamine dehydrogenase accessory protein MauD